MKRLFFLLLIFASYSVFSQDCGGYYYFQNNKVIEMTITNKKGKETGKMVYAISNVNKNERYCLSYYKL